MQGEKKYQTIIVLISALLLASLWFHTRLLIPIAPGLGLISVLFPAVALFIHVWWMKLAMVMGKISNAVLLSVIFFVVIAPVGLLRRLRTRSRQQMSTSFRERHHVFTKQDLEKSW